MTIERLARALERSGAQPTFDDLRDILWLAAHLPPARALAGGLAQAPDTTPPGDAAAPADAPLPPAERARREDEPPPRSRPVDAGTDADTDDATRVYGGGANAPGAAARRIQLPGVAPLPGALDIARALRPLGRRRAFGPASVLDEVATAERIAETGLPLPVLTARRERWFDIVLAVEDTPSLLAWRATVVQLQRLLERHGGFRAVLPVTLSHEAGSVAIRSANGTLHPAASMTDRHGRRLLIVVADCTSAAWHDGAMGVLLSEIARRAPVAIAQPLPPPLWSNTALGFVEFHARAETAGAPTAQLHVVRPRWAADEPGPVVPVFALQADSVARWARMVMAAGGAFCDAALLPLPETDDPPAEAPLAPAPLALLAAFRAVATPDAQRLAACLAVVKPLTMPVMRLIQGAMLAEADASALAQVLIAGLLVPSASGPKTAEDETVHAMDDAVREQLAGTLRRSDWLRVNLAVQRFIESRTGLGFDFLAYLEDALGDDQVAPAALPFAQFAKTLADRFRAPGSASRHAGGRQVEEAVFGDGLTVMASTAVATPIRRLDWSADGRLMALHATGVDVFAARSLAGVARVRSRPHVVEWLVHDDDRPLLAPWLARLEQDAERQSGEPFLFRLVAYDPSAASRPPELRDDDYFPPPSVTRLVALTRRFALPERRLLSPLAPGTPAAEEWQPLPLHRERQGPRLPDWLRTWVGLLDQAPASNAAHEAIAALLQHIGLAERTRKPGRIVQAAWLREGQRCDLVSLRSAAGQPLIVDLAQEDLASPPRSRGVPHGPRLPVDDLDVDPTTGAFAVVYRNGEAWAWNAGSDGASRKVLDARAATVRWSPVGGLLGHVDEGGFAAQSFGFERAPRRRG